MKYCETTPFQFVNTFFKKIDIQQSLHQLIIQTNHWHSGCLKARPASPLLNPGWTLMCHRILRTRRCFYQKTRPSSLKMLEILKLDERGSLVSKRNKLRQKSFFSNKVWLMIIFCCCCLCFWWKDVFFTKMSQCNLPVPVEWLYISVFASGFSVCSVKNVLSQIHVKFMYLLHPLRLCHNRNSFDYLGVES